MDRNIFGAQTSQGYLFGNSSSADLVNVFVAGIAIRPNSASESLKLMRNSSGTDDLKKVNKKSYIAFAAYEDKLSDAKGATLYGNDAANGNVTVAVSPYVTTSPTSGLVVRASDADTAGRYLFGDGMNDLCMFGQGWLSIAMGNARDALKAKADYITTDVDKDGLWNACKHFGWI